RIEYAWGGYLDITMNRAPHFGRLGPNAYFVQGLSGHGMVIAGMAGRLASEVIGGTAERFDVFARIPHRDFPGGTYFRRPALLVVLATITWLLSMALRNVGLSEPLWPLMLFVAGVTLALHADPRAPRLSLVLWPLAAWAIRLAIHLTKRFAGKEEARRHRASRDRHGPHFGL